MMRFVITSLITLFVGVLYFVDQPRHWELVSHRAQEELHRWIYDKRVTVEGLDLLPDEKVRSLLPLERSVIWWKSNHSLIEGQLLQSSLISRALVSECGWGCFVIRVAERTPAFFAVVGNRGWIVGQDGGLIKPIAIEKLSAYLQGGIYGGSGAASAGAHDELQIPVVTGLLSAEGSSDIVRSRFEHVRKAIEIVQRITGRRVSSLEFVYGKELRMHFFGVPFDAIFASGEQASEELIADQALRLSKLLAEAGEGASGIRSVDLGFDKLAAITPVETPRAHSGAGASAKPAAH